jgi:hypothetical protein
MVASVSFSLMMSSYALDPSKDLAHSNLAGLSKAIMNKSLHEAGMSIPLCFPTGAKCHAQSLVPTRFCLGATS